MSDNEERRVQPHRRVDDELHMEWAAKVLGGVVVFTAVLSVGASTTISAMMTSFLANTTDARVDAIRFDVNAMQRQIDRFHSLK